MLLVRIQREAHPQGYGRLVVGDAQHVSTAPPRPMPICAICREPVRALQADRDLASEDVVLTAVCHGRRDERRIPLIDIELADSVEEAIARVVPWWWPAAWPRRS